MERILTQKPRAVLLDTIEDTATRGFETAGFTVDTFPENIDPDNLVDMCDGADFLGIRSGPKIPLEFVRRASGLLAIGCYCVGTEQVKHDAAGEYGVAVFNAPYENGRSVAEMVIGQTVNLFRQLPAHNERLHDGEWYKTAAGSHELRDKTMGIIGYGNIGKQVGMLANAFGMRVLYHDIADQLRLGIAEPTDLATLLKESDVVTLHVPGGLTEPIIGADELAQMKDTAYLINAARAKAVDYDAVSAALEQGELAGAAFDVYPDEPAKKRADFESQLRQHPNVLLTPHVGGSTVEAQTAIAKAVTNKLIRYKQTGASAGAINIPEVGLPVQPNTTRLAYLHANQVGAIAEMSELLAEYGNVTAAELRTRGEIGYAMYNIEGTPSVQELETAVSGLSACIKGRVIG
jgi:D-3-phosphoglycerate dehydrogenase